MNAVVQLIQPARRSEPKATRRKTVAMRCIDKIAGEQLRLERLSRRVSQQALAEGMGLTFQALQRLEKGENGLSLSRFIQLASLLDLDAAGFVNDLIDGDVQSRSLEETAAAQARAEVYALLSTPNALEMMRLFSQMPAKSRNAILEVARGVVDRTDGKA